MMLQLAVRSVLVDQSTWSMNVRITFPCSCVSALIFRADVVLKSGKVQRPYPSHVQGHELLEFGLRRHNDLGVKDLSLQIEETEHLMNSGEVAFYGYSTSIGHTIIPST